MEGTPSARDAGDADRDATSVRDRQGAALSGSPELLPTIDDVVFSLGPALLDRLLSTAENPDWHFLPEEVRRGIISGRIAAIGVEDEGAQTSTPEPGDLLTFVSPAVRVKRMGGDPNSEYPHITHGEMLASVVCRAWDIPYSYRDFLALLGSDGVPAQKQGATASGSCYFRYVSTERLFLLQGRLPQERERLVALRPAFEEALGETVAVGIGQVPPHLYHLRTAATQ
jgi:hypothetical protein